VLELSGAIGVLLTPEAVLAEGDDRQEVELLRWDLVQSCRGQAEDVVGGGEPRLLAQGRGSLAGTVR
jgi:hypothetical protein